MKAVRFFFGSPRDAFFWAREANWWRGSDIKLYRDGTVAMMVGHPDAIARVAELATASSEIHPLSSTFPALMPHVSYGVAAEIRAKLIEARQGR